MVRGGILLDMKNPAKMLPIAKRLIELINEGMFSLMMVGTVNRGCFISE